MPGSQLRAIVAHNIREYAADRGISLNSLADFAGVSRSQLFNVLAGDSGTTLEWLERIAIALDVEPSDLLRAPAKRSRRRHRKGA